MTFSQAKIYEAMSLTLTVHQYHPFFWKAKVPNMRKKCQIKRATKSYRTKMQRSIPSVIYTSLHRGKLSQVIATSKIMQWTVSPCLLIISNILLQNISPSISILENTFQSVIKEFYKNIAVERQTSHLKLARTITKNGVLASYWLCLAL